MHKLVLNFFKGLRSFLQLSRIVIVFTILMMLFYWIKNLAGFNYSFLDFIKPLLDSLLALGASISNGYVDLFAAKFEYKYAIANGILLALYAFTYLLNKVVDFFEDSYLAGRSAVKSLQEAAMNKSLKQEAENEQKKLKRYQIYIGVSEKKKFAQQVINIDIKEQYQILNKFLIEKTGVNPIAYKDGFIYSYGNIEHIDNILDEFFKAVNSKAPLNYYVCVQVIGASPEFEKLQLETMIGLNIANKIITMADTVWRYKFNSKTKYETVLIGDFKSAGKNFEIHEFRNNFGV